MSVRGAFRNDKPVLVFILMWLRLCRRWVRYKCDFCADRLQDGQTPACAQSCPQKAISFLPLEQALITVRQMAANRYLYGVNENGGTATWYISSVPFEELNKAIVENQKNTEKAGRPAFQAVAPQLKESSSWAIATLAAPLAARGHRLTSSPDAKSLRKRRTSDASLSSKCP